MSCPHQSRASARGQFDCALGLYGGKPWLGNCTDCIAKGHNTQEYADSISLERTHPGDPAKDCCGSADPGAPWKKRKL